MTALRYVGPDPLSDATITNKLYADVDNSSTQVTSDYVHQQTALTTPNLANAAYIAAQVANCVSAAQLSTQLSSYALKSLLGTANGIATTDVSGRLAAAQVPPGTKTDRVMTSYSPTDANTFLKPGTTQIVLTTQVREYKVATIIVPDPGFPWRPIPLGVIQGYATGNNPGVRTLGNGDYGLISVMPPAGVSDQVYGCAICTGVFSRPDFYQIIPYGAGNQTPLTVPPVIGGLQLDVYASNSSGNGYAFLGTGLNVQILVAPAL